jgi:hypothetical protein
MSYDESDAMADAFYDRIYEEFYPEHKEQAIDEFIEERMQSFFLKNPHIIEAPMVSYRHANNLVQVSPRSALVMYTTAIELFLKVVLLKPVLYGMVHNENVAELIISSTIGQTGFSRYNKLLSGLCLHAANIELSNIRGINGKSILSEAEEVQRIRNKVVHQGYVCTVNEMGLAKNIASLILTKVVEPVLNNLNLVITSTNSRFSIVKA